MTGGFYSSFISRGGLQGELWLEAAEPLALLWEGHGDEVFDPDYSSHQDQDSSQVENGLLNRSSPLMDAESVVNLELLLGLLELEVS